jgi:cytochrome oxidase assembly protein ShyY1
VNPKAAFIIIVVAVVVVALVVWLGIWWVGRQAGVRRAEFNRIKRERASLVVALDQIEQAADTYRDLESPLAAQIRTVIRSTRMERNSLS